MKITFISQLWDREGYYETEVSCEGFFLTNSKISVRKLIPKKYEKNIQDRLVDECFYEAKRKVKELLESDFRAVKEVAGNG